MQDEGRELATARAESVVRAVAAVGLPGAALPGDGSELTPEEWRRVLERVAFERLQGALAATIGAGYLGGVPEPVAVARAATYESLAMTLPLDLVLTDTVDLLTGAGVDVRVLKGVALAQLDYPSTVLRSYIDVDLLIHPRHFDTAVASMIRAGHGRRGLPERRPGFDRRFAKDVTFVTASGRGVDLHRTFTLGPFGQAVRIDDLWQTSQPFTLAGRTLHALPLELRFLNVCYHAAIGTVPPRLVPLRDVAQLLASPELDVDEVRRLMRGWRAEAVVSRALTLVEAELRLPLGELGRWAREYIPRPWEQRALRPYLEAVGPGPERSLETLRLIPSWRRKVRYAHAQLFPSRIYLEGRYPGYRAYWSEHLNHHLHRGGH